MVQIVFQEDQVIKIQNGHRLIRQQVHGHARFGKCLPLDACSIDLAAKGRRIGPIVMKDGRSGNVIRAGSTTICILLLLPFAFPECRVGGLQDTDTPKGDGRGSLFVVVFLFNASSAAVVVAGWQWYGLMRFRPFL
jgi:hypothetical protein